VLDGTWTSARNLSTFNLIFEHSYTSMKKSILVWMALVSAQVHAQPAAPAGSVRVMVNPGDSGEQSRVANFSAWKTAIEQVLRKERISNFMVSLSNDATADLSATRSRTQDIFVAPAHVIGSAVRYGYTPVLGLDKPVQAVLVAPKDSGIDSFAAAAGKRLGLPLQDSVVTYLLRGEVNAANTTIKKHFHSVYDTRYQEALLPCLQLRRCDVVAVERSLYERWVAAGEPLKIVLESKAVPGVAVAIRDNAKPRAEILRASLSTALAGSDIVKSDKITTHGAADFRYVSTLGYFTPRALPGATLVEAKTVAQLLQKGATYIDARNQEEFDAGHVPGAKLVPYVEKSHKEADFDPNQDKFDVAQLGDKNAEFVFGCNGAECWKSFKASAVALKAGYKNVYWFRGGLPEWRDAGNKVELGPQKTQRQ
jgi:rhodanese-related sulfurtransferase/ABC-type phosphate/phosphonate transport system substrate-binding protein